MKRDLSLWEIAMLTPPHLREVLVKNWRMLEQNRYLIPNTNYYAYTVEADSETKQDKT
jgi:hypothetical protein